MGIKEILFSIFIRYAILVLLALNNLWLFYLIFTPLTIYPVLFLLGLFFDVSIQEGVIRVNDCFPMQVIGPCIAASAYYLLLILNLSIPNQTLLRRIKMISFAFISFLIINIIRIFVLAMLFISKSSLFDITHMVFWYALSILFVIGIWFLEVRIFKLKEIPLYSDIKSIYNSSG